MMREQIPHTEGGGGIHSRAYNQRDGIPAPWHESEIEQNILFSITVVTDVFF